MIKAFIIHLANGRRSRCTALAYAKAYAKAYLVVGLAFGLLLGLNLRGRRRGLVYSRPRLSRRRYLLGLCFLGRCGRGLGVRGCPYLPRLAIS